jgi:DNA-binding MarR family transcriptional regulator
MTRWLNDDQQRVWRSYLLGTTLLMERLDRDLRDKHRISLPEYEILVRLSESNDRMLRMAELADSVRYSRSRITHTIARMEAENLVTRSQCSSDGRGVFAQMTDAGYAKLVAAAPDHVESVRTSLLDAASEGDFLALGRVFRAVIDALETGSPDPVLSPRDA